MKLILLTLLGLFFSLSTVAGLRQRPARLVPTPANATCTTNAECLRLGLPLLRPTRRQICPEPPQASADPRSATFGVACSRQRWTVPESAYYYISATGARGGDKDTAKGGLGGTIGYEFLLKAGDVYTVVVGRQGQSFGYDVGAGGGGLSIVYRESDNQMVIAAGGGGGAGKGNKAYGDGKSAPTPSLSGIGALLIAGSAGGGFNNNGGTQGTSGNGGGGSTAGRTGGAGGAGWSGDGGKSVENRSGGKSKPSWSGGIYRSEPNTEYTAFGLGGDGGGAAPGDYGVSLVPSETIDMLIIPGRRRCGILGWRRRRVQHG